MNYLINPPYGSNYNQYADPNNPAYDPLNPNTAPALDGYPKYGDAALDNERYHRPLERLHGMGLHSRGVAFGMQIKCTKGQPDVTILPGLALDSQGRHIYLAANGKALLGAGANQELDTVDPATGVSLPTVNKNTGQPIYAVDTYYVVAQWYENWNPSSYASDPNIGQFDITPWLQLVTAVNPDVHVILGEVVLDAAGNIQSASYGDMGGLQRTSIRLPAQSLQLRRAVTTTATVVTNTGTETVEGADTNPWGAVRAREAGGIEVAVENSSDHVDILNDAGGTFAELTVAASQAAFGDPSNPGINLIGAGATIIVGAAGLDGQVLMQNAQAQNTMSLDGNAGAAAVQRVRAFANNNVIDIDTFALHVHGGDFVLDGRSGNNNRAMVD